MAEHLDTEEPYLTNIKYYRYMLIRWAQNKKYVYQHGYSTSKADGKRIMVYRQPWYVDRVVAMSEFLCAITLHYWCSEWFFMDVDKWADTKRVYFYINSTDEEVLRWCEFLGMEKPYWADEDDEE